MSQSSSDGNSITAVSQVPHIDEKPFIGQLRRLFYQSALPRLPFYPFSPTSFAVPAGKLQQWNGTEWVDV